MATVASTIWRKAATGVMVSATSSRHTGTMRWRAARDAERRSGPGPLGRPPAGRAHWSGADGLRGGRRAEGPVEAGAVAGVAGPGPRLVHLDQQRVAVAVVADAPDVLTVARRLPLAPELLPAPAPEPGAPGLEGAAEGLGVHPGEHEDGPVGGVLDDGAHQPVGGCR